MLSSAVKALIFYAPKQQQQLRRHLCRAGCALSCNDTAFRQKSKRAVSADLRGAPVLRSMSSTYWLLKLRVSEFTLHTLKEQGELVLSLETFIEEQTHQHRVMSLHQPFFNPVNICVVSPMTLKRPYGTWGLSLSSGRCVISILYPLFSFFKLKPFMILAPFLSWMH